MLQPLWKVREAGVFRWFLAIYPRALRMFPPIGPVNNSTSGCLCQRKNKTSKALFIYLFIFKPFGSAGSSLLCAGFLYLWPVGATLQLRCVGFPSPQVLLLWRVGFWSSGPWSTGSAVVAHGLSCPKMGGIFLDHGLELVSTVLQGGFLITGPPGKPKIQRFMCKVEHPNTSFISAIYDSYKCPFIERLSYSVFLGWNFEQLYGLPWWLRG